jgi:hypothetical protein
LPVETTSEDGGDGGYGALNRKIESVKSDEKLQIALYDRDEGGFKKGFLKLNKNLAKYQNKEHVKRHKNKRSFAIVFPAQQGLEDYIKFCNLPIEFLFNTEDLKKKNSDGKGLELVPFQRELKFGGETIESISKDETYLCSIDKSSKKVFAEEIVTEFEVESFKYFKLIFEEIEAIINENEAQKLI